MNQNKETAPGQGKVDNDGTEDVGGLLRYSLRERPCKSSAKRKVSEEAKMQKALDDKEREAASNKGKLSMYDDKGRIRATGEDLCDCLQRTCPGCHFKCKNCGSPKCGIHCRVNRKFAYDCIEFDGKDDIIINPALEQASSSK